MSQDTPLGLAGRRIIVTGGSRGVGRATALLCARLGADVGLTYLSRAAAAEGVAAEVRASGRRAAVVQAGFTDIAGSDAAIGTLADALGGLDGFVANAGIWPEAEVPLRDLDEARWRATIRIDLDGVFYGTRAALRRMASGSVVLVSSTAGQRGEAFHADYAATKGALISLAKSLAVECAPAVRVNCVAPGWIDTEMVAGALAGEARPRAEAGIPLRRIASADDVAGPIAFLLGDLARHVTGEVLNVNGGSVLCG
ncbi:MAG: SDR family NAD(P)-dependent oxidoreductase [Gemmatimonadales bacterium]|nr:SDR family NAD(P)-dependent oxidoreductase [Gemmatimonadales bacterium]